MTAEVKIALRVNDSSMASLPPLNKYIHVQNFEPTRNQTLTQFPVSEFQSKYSI